MVFKKSILSNILKNRLKLFDPALAIMKYIKIRSDLEIIALRNDRVNISGFWVDLRSLRIDSNNSIYIEVNDWQQMARKFDRKDKDKKRC